MLEVDMLWKMLEFEALRCEVTLSLIVGRGACGSHRVAFAFHTSEMWLWLKGGRRLAVVAFALSHRCDDHPRDQGSCAFDSVWSENVALDSQLQGKCAHERGRSCATE